MQDMFLMEWTKEMESGLDLLDKQHRRLFRAANSFYVKYKFDHKVEAAKDITDFLTNYFLQHFQAEEAFQRQSDYPLANEHQAKHDFIGIQFKGIDMELRDSYYGDASCEKLYNFVVVYIKEHTTQDDAHFCSYYKNKAKQD